MIDLKILTDIRELKIKNNFQIEINYNKKQKDLKHIINVSTKLFITHKYNDLIFIDILSDFPFSSLITKNKINNLKESISKSLKINFKNYKKKLNFLFFYQHQFFYEENDSLIKLNKKDYLNFNKFKDFQLIKSKERVKDLAEVYTNEREVNVMLDLVKDYSYDIKRTFLEPACGNGNFLIKILERKIEAMKKLKTFEKRFSKKNTEYYFLRCISNIYGIDICPENVFESKQRLKNYIINEYNNLLQDDVSFAFEKSLDYVLDRTIVKGNSLTEENKIFFSQFVVNKHFMIQEKIFCLKDLYQDKPIATKIFKPIEFLNIYKNEFTEKGDEQ